MDNFQKPQKSFGTRAIHYGQEPEKWNHMSMVTPIVTSASYKQTAPGEFAQYEYSRCGNPTRNTLEECLATLEMGKYGLVFATGLGAITAITYLLECGDHILCGDDIYGGTNRSFSKLASRYGITVTFCDFVDLNVMKMNLRTNTKLVFFETPTNPTLKVIDIEQVSKIVHDFNKNIIVAVDNTFLTPYFQQPLNLGVDLVMHSISKYLNGHCDVVMGAVILKCDQLHKRLRYIQNASGIVPAPFDCYQVIRGLKTLHIRMDRHQSNAFAIAKFLDGHLAVIAVRHPGLISHPQYQLTLKQTSGHSGMVSFWIRGGQMEVGKFIDSLKVFTLAGSLGTVESLVEIPKLMSHASIPNDEQHTLEISDTFIRLSIGIEDVEDLINDLDNALKASQS